MASRAIIIVTGAARRIGAAIARHLHQRGSDIALHCRHSKTQAQQLEHELNCVRPDSARLFVADLCAPSMCAALVQQTHQWRGRIDGLVNNASSFYRTPLAKIDEAAWSDLMNSNLKSTLFLIQAAAPALKAQRGAIINLCDARSDRPLPQFGLYAAAKSGVVALTRSLALELAPDIRVNAVSPGTILFPEEAGSHSGFSSEEMQSIRAAIPLQQPGTGEDIARAVAFLLGEPYITGQILNVDGGSSIVSAGMIAHRPVEHA